MKSLVFFLFALPAFAQTQTKSFLTARPKVLSVLACKQPRLQTVAEWEAAGFVIANSNNEQDYVRYARQKLQKLSPYMAEEMFGDAPPILAEMEFSLAGVADAKGLGQPQEVNGCAAVPVAIEAAHLREGKPYLIDWRLYERLPASDRRIALLLLSGFRPEIVRTLLDERNDDLSDIDRYYLLRSQGVPTAVFKNVEIPVLSPDISFEEDRLITAPVWANRDIQGQASFDRAGRLRQLKTRYSSFFNRSLGPNGMPAFVSYRTDGAVSCSEASFREDGSMAVCDSAYFDNQGLLIAKNMTVLQAPSAHPARRIQNTSNNNNSPSRWERHLVLVNNSDTVQTITLEDVKSELASLILLTGEEECNGFSYTSTAQPEFNPPVFFNVSVVLPANCSGVFRAEWR